MNGGSTHGIDDLGLCLHCRSCPCSSNFPPAEAHMEPFTFSFSPWNDHFQRMLDLNFAHIPHSALLSSSLWVSEERQNMLYTLYSVLSSLEAFKPWWWKSVPYKFPFRHIPFQDTRFLLGLWTNSTIILSPKFITNKECSKKLPSFSFSCLLFKACWCKTKIP